MCISDSIWACVTPKRIVAYIFLFLFPYGIFQHIVYNEHFNLLPDVNNQVWIGSGTKHQAGSVGLLLFEAALAILYPHRNFNLVKKQDWYYKIMLLFGVYLVVFSGARTYLMSLAVVIILFAVNYNRFRALLSTILAVFSIISVYSLEKLSDYNFEDDSAIAELAHADQFDRYGVTSGRSWLWEYHCNLFVESDYFLGVGKDPVNFRVNDILEDGTKAKAASESYWTAILAKYGILAIGIYFIPFTLFYVSVKRKNTMAMIVIFSIILSTTLGSGLVSPIGSGISILYISLFFYVLNIYDKQKNIERI